MDKLVEAGYKQVVVNCHHLADQIKSAVAGRPEVILQHEAEVLGTGGGLRKALNFFTDEPVLVMNGDIYHDVDLHRLRELHAANGANVTLALHDYPRFNTVQVRADQVCGFSADEKSTDENLLAFTGIHMLNRTVIEQIPAECFFHIIDLYKKLARLGQIGCVRVDGCFWQDIGTPDDYLDLHRHLLCAEKEKPFWRISEQATIGRQVKFRGWGTVGRGALIGDSVKLSRCVVWEGVSIAAGEQLADKICTPKVF
ncbi:MAG: nucleotidyltransferase family protein [Candidatus Electrothrix sp. AR4]|nr:nucleotidyltransferase family protein [Candidatus Electrothrix sp. AR4]